MRDKSNDPIVDLNESVEMLLKQVDAAEAKLLRLDEIATALRRQASTIDGRLAHTDKLIGQYKQIIEESAELLRSSTSALDQSKDSALAGIGQAVERSLESHRQQIAEAQAIFQRELTKLAEEERSRFAEDIEKFKGSQDRVSADLEALLMDTAKAFESQVTKLQVQMDEFAQTEAGKVRKELEAAFQLWQTKKLPDAAVQAVTTATTSALAELKAEVLAELRRPWWKRRPRE